MPTLTIRHITSYRYRQPVAFDEHRLMLRPRAASDQRVLEAASCYSLEYPHLNRPLPHRGS